MKKYYVAISAYEHIELLYEFLALSAILNWFAWATVYASCLLVTLQHMLYSKCLSNKVLHILDYPVFILC